MLHEAIKAGDAQTRRVLQLQRAVGQTRRTLAACLLRACLSAAGRSQCAHAIRVWSLCLLANARQRATLDAKQARDGASRARETARASEAIAREAQEAAAREVEAVKKRLAAAEKSRASLRDQVCSRRPFYLHPPPCLSDLLATADDDTCGRYIPWAISWKARGAHMSVQRRRMPIN